MGLLDDLPQDGLSQDTHGAAQKQYLQQYVDCYHKWADFCMSVYRSWPRVRDVGYSQQKHQEMYERAYEMLKPLTLPADIFCIVPLMKDIGGFRGSTIMGQFISAAMNLLPDKVYYLLDTKVTLIGARLERDRILFNHADLPVHGHVGQNAQGTILNYGTTSWLGGWARGAILVNGGFCGDSSPEENTFLLNTGKIIRIDGLKQGNFYINTGKVSRLVDNLRIHAVGSSAFLQFGQATALHYSEIHNPIHNLTLPVDNNCEPHHFVDKRSILFRINGQSSARFLSMEDGSLKQFLRPLEDILSESPNLNTLEKINETYGIKRPNEFVHKLFRIAFPNQEEWWPVHS